MRLFRHHSWIPQFNTVLYLTKKCNPVTGLFAEIAWCCPKSVTLPPSVWRHADFESAQWHFCGWRRDLWDWILVKTAPLRKGLNRNGPNQNGLKKLSRLPKRPHKNCLNRNGLNRNGPTGWWSQTKTAPSKICTYYLGYRNGLTKTASTETAPRDDGAKPKRPHLKFASIIHGLDNIRTKIVSFKEKVKKLDTALFKNSYLILWQNQNRNGPISNLQA